MGDFVVLDKYTAQWSNSTYLSSYKIFQLYFFKLNCTSKVLSSSYKKWKNAEKLFRKNHNKFCIFLLSVCWFSTNYGTNLMKLC